MRAFFYNAVCFAAGALCLLLLLHYAGVNFLLAGHPALWGMAAAAALYAAVPLRPKTGGQGGDKCGDRPPYNTHAPKSDKPVWRNIPGYATPVLDTNVPMCPDENIRSRFGFSLHHAAKQDWHVVVHGAVYEPGPRMEIPEPVACARRPDSVCYAAPKLIEYMCRHERFSFDNDLKIRCKQLIRTARPKKRVFPEEDFYA